MELPVRRRWDRLQFTLRGRGNDDCESSLGKSVPLLFCIRCKSCKAIAGQSDDLRSHRSSAVEHVPPVFECISVTCDEDTARPPQLPLTNKLWSQRDSGLCTWWRRKRQMGRVGNSGHRDKTADASEEMPLMSALERVIRWHGTNELLLTQMRQSPRTLG